MEKKNDEPLSDRIKKSPIHQWANVEDYLNRAQVPERLHEPFHEIIIARGKYPWNIDTEQAKAFGKAAVDITQKFEVTPPEGRPLLMMYQQLADQWVEFKQKQQ